jgi:transposase
MFFPEGQVRVHLYGRPVDLRRSFDGLYALTRQELDEDPMSGRLFAFINRRATQMKVLYWDRTGFCVWAKRLEQGRFVSDWGRVSTKEMDWTGLKLLLEGIEPAVVRRRYKHSATVMQDAKISTLQG